MCVYMYIRTRGIFVGGRECVGHGCWWVWLWFGRFLSWLRGWLLLEWCRSSWLAGNHRSLKEGKRSSEQSLVKVRGCDIMHTQYWIKLIIMT